MKKLYTNKALIYIKLVLSLIVIFSFSYSSFGQVRVPFSPRAANTTPTKTVYSIKGDFTMIGNSNLTTVNYSDGGSNFDDVEYVDIDTDPNTLNSSSATLGFSSENGALEECSKVVYAGLYWTGRAFDENETDTDIFNVTKDGITKTYNKRKVSIKGPNSTNYTELTATNIAFPTNNDDANMYSAYMEVTDYVQQNGIGEYFVADIATREGNDSSGTGYYGGWGMVIVYENSKMNWRDVTVFDGHAYVLSGTANHSIPISGFTAIQNGDVNVKLGLMAGEGDTPWTGDYFEILRQDDNTYERLSHSGNSTDNFFNSSIVTGGNTRNPNLQNNTGIDIAMFDIDNTSNGIIDNNQTSTTLRYGSTLDSYIIFNVTFSVDTYIPEPELVISNPLINGNPHTGSNSSLEPGENADYSIKIRNTGTEGLDNTVITIPIPLSIDSGIITINSNVFAPLTTITNPNTPSYDANVGPNGSIVWNLGNLPTPSDPNDILAELELNFTVTTDCNIVSNVDFSPNVAIDGSISGTGSISNVSFNTNLILGYQTTGACTNEPILGPSLVPIDITDFANQPPTISCPINISQGVDTGLCGAIITFTAPVGTDNCANPTTVQIAGLASGQTFPLGTTTNTFEVTDEFGLKATCSFDVVITDDENPTISCPGDISQGVDTGLCGAVITFAAPVGTDNCANPTTVQIAGLASGQTFPVGTTTNTFEVTDAAGLKATCSFDVVITDDENPTISCPNNISQGVDTGLCGAVITFTTPVGTDNCANPTTVQIAGLASGQTFPVGTTTNTFEVTDAAGLKATCSFDVVITDDENPTISCPGNITQNINASNCIGTSINLGIPTALDNCAIDTITNNAPTEFPIGDTFVIWTVIDTAGLKATCTQTVTIIDNINPTIICPIDLIVSPDSGLCTASSVNLGTPTTSDCNVASVVNDASEPFTLGETIVTWTVTDNSGNKATCSQKITVIDDQLPTITCPIDVSVIADSDLCSATNVDLGSPTFNDNCTGTTISNNATEPFAIGETIITWTATDGSGNKTTCTQKVTVVDDQLPTITCPADVTANTDSGVCSASNIDLEIPDFNDNCIGSTIVNDAIQPFTIGETIVTWTVTDASGNKATCTQKVTILDDQSPTITCPTDITVVADTNLCSATNVDLGTPNFNDNCSGSTITNDAIEPFALGETIVTWTVTDASGNKATCTQKVTVTDDQLPTITCPIDITVEADAGLCSASSVDLSIPVTTDNCSVESVLNNALEPFALGETIVTWTVTDGSGNKATCNQKITVIDGNLPKITCPPSVTVNVDPNSCEATNVSFANLDVKDCTNVTITNGAPTTFPIGETTFTWTVRDSAGNESTCNQTVTVLDNIAPTFIESLPPTSITVECDNVPTADILTAIDNCGTADVTFNEIRTDGSCESSYILKRTWVATDSGNLRTIHSQTVIVQDTTAPVFDGILPAETTVECDNIPSAQTLTATDNCNTATITVNDVRIDGSCDSSYKIERTWTATDACGLETKHTQTINVQDTTAPKPTTNFETELTVSCTEIPNIPNLKFSDNCSSNITVAFNETNSFNEDAPTDYEIIRTWTVKDDCDNKKIYTQKLNVNLDEIITEVTAPQRCFDDGVVDLEDFITVDKLDGVWEMVEGDPKATLTNNIFDATNLELAKDFLPDEGIKEYLFRYTTTDGGCISITEISMTIDATCVVLPCGQNDIEISKALTPNGDGFNDSFDIMGIDLCGFSADVKVFNRWGALIYDDTNYVLGEKQGSWNGFVHKSSIGGSGTVPNGTYYYIIVLKNSGLKPFTGSLYIGTK